MQILTAYDLGEYWEYPKREEEGKKLGILRAIYLQSEVMGKS